MATLLKTKTLTDIDANGYSNWYKMKVEVYLNKQTNTSDKCSSNITIKRFFGTQSNSAGWYSYKTPTLSSSISVNGGSFGNSSSTTINDLKQNNKGNWVQFGSWTGDIEHQSDGTQKINVKLDFTAGSTASYISKDASLTTGEFSLPTIPRESKITGGSGNIGEKTSINITRANENFTHTLEYEFGNLTGIIAENVGTSYEWTIPTSFYGEIKDSNSGTGSIICKTYNGETLIGTSNIEFTANVVNSDPVISTFSYKDSNAITTEITEDNQRIIRNNSTLLFTIGSATPKNSATIVKYEVIFNGVTKTSEKAGDVDFGTINLSSNATATLKVTDSRGNTSSVTKEVIIDDWVLPNADITLKRKSNFYSESYLKADCNYSSLNGKNTLSIQYQYRKIDDKEITDDGDLENNIEKTLDLDNNYKWHVIVFVSDRIGQTKYNLYLDRGIPIIFFDKLLNSIGVNCFPLLAEVLVSKNPIYSHEGECTNYGLKNLFTNASGTNGSITLSESSANFQYLEIFYSDSNGADVQSVRVPAPNNKIVTLSCIEPNSTPKINIKTSRYTIVGTSITYVRSVLGSLENSVVPSVTTDNNIKIIKVVGYK